MKMEGPPYTFGLSKPILSIEELPDPQDQSVQPNPPEPTDPPGQSVPPDPQHPPNPLETRPTGPTREHPENILRTSKNILRRSKNISEHLRKS